MKKMSMVLGLLAASSVIEATMAQAEGFKAGGQCNGSSFNACASVQVAPVGRDPASGASNLSDFRIASHTVRIGDGREGSEPTTDPETPGGNIPTPCASAEGVSWNLGDCSPTAVTPDPVTITPEPFSMTLIATGLLGILGVSQLRKRNGTG